MKIRIWAAGRHIATYQLHPIWRAINELRDLGYEFVDKEDPNFDYSLVQTTGFGKREGKQAKEFMQKHSPIILLDDAASTGTHKMRFMKWNPEDCVGYIKKQILRDRELYKTKYPRKRNHYYRLSQIGTHLNSGTKPDNSVTDKTLTRLHLGWSLALMQRHGIQITKTPIFKNRPLDIHYSVKTKHKTKVEKENLGKIDNHYAFHRVGCSLEVDRISRKYGYSISGPCRGAAYLRNMEQSKICISPLGLGEVCLTGDTKISLLDGSEVPIKELVGKKEFYVYSYNHDTNKVVPGRGHSCRLTKKKVPIITIVLDNGEKIRCDHDERFLLRNGRYLKANKLVIGDSLMPLYRRVHNGEEYVNVNEYSNGYEELKHPNGEWQLTHRMVYLWKYGIMPKKVVCHHSSFNSRNNSPKFLIAMSWKQHLKYHTDHNYKINDMLWNPDNPLYYLYKESRNKHSEKLSESLSLRNIENWNDPDYREKMIDILQTNVNEKVWGDPECKEQLINSLLDSWTDERREDFSVNNPMKNLDVAKKVSLAHKKLVEEGIHYLQSDEAKLLSSKRSKQLWTTEEYREKLSHRVYDSEVMREASLKRWKDPAYRERQLKLMAEGLNKPEVRAKISKTTKKRWEDPTYKAKVVSKMKVKAKERSTNPEYLKKLSVASKKAWTDEERRKDFSKNNPMNDRKNVNKIQETKIKKTLQKLINTGMKINECNYNNIKLAGTARWDKIAKYFGNVDNAVKKLSPTYNHKIVDIIYETNTEDVYDFTVDTYHNFALSAGVFVHNCFRELEAISYGSIVIKPDMSHIETWPDIYRAYETYIPCKWDWSDLEEVVHKVLSDYRRYIPIAQEAFRVVKSVWDNKVFATKFDEIMKGVISTI